MGHSRQFDCFTDLPMVATTETGIQTQGEAMQVTTINGSAEHQTEQQPSKATEMKNRVLPLSWGTIAEIAFVVIAASALVWSLFR